MEKKMEGLIAALRPILQRNGGDVLFRGYDGATHTVFLSFQRAEYRCPGANGAIQMLFMKKIRCDFPEVEHISILEA